MRPRPLGGETFCRLPIQHKTLSNKAVTPSWCWLSLCLPY